MHTNKIKFFSLSIFLITSIATAMPADLISNPNQSIRVTKDSPQFKITLSSNPTTGYSWMIERYNSRFIRVIGHHFEAPKTSMMGASGVDVWTFEVKPDAFIAPQVLKVHMLYARPWNVNEDSRKVVFNIVT